MSETADRCRNCGTPKVSGSRVCEACDEAEYGTLILQSADTGQVVKMTIDTVVGKRNLGFAGADAQYASEPQFRVHRDKALGGWAVTSDPAAKNVTHVNGIPMGADAMAISDGTVISLAKDKLKLTARVEG